MPRGSPSTSNGGRGNKGTQNRRTAASRSHASQRRQSDDRHNDGSERFSNDEESSSGSSTEGEGNNSPRRSNPKKQPRSQVTQSNNSRKRNKNSDHRSTHSDLSPINNIAFSPLDDIDANENMSTIEEPGPEATAAELRLFIELLQENNTVKDGKHGPQVILNKGFVQKIGKTMLNKIWRTIKFVSSKGQQRVLTDKIFEECAFTTTMNKDQFFELYGAQCLQSLNKIRNYRVVQMKECVWDYMGSNNHEEPPPVAHIIACAKRKITEALAPTFVWYIGRFLPMAAGHLDWGNNHKYFTTVSASCFPDNPNKLTVPTSTEAFCVAAYRGYREMWVMQYNWRQKYGKSRPFPNVRRNKTSPPLTDEQKKWRCEYTDPDSGSTPFGGWSTDGLNSYVNIRKEVKLQRALPESQELEINGMRSLRALDNITQATLEEYTANKNKRKHVSTVVTEEVADLLTDEE